MRQCGLPTQRIVVAGHSIKITNQDKLLDTFRKEKKEPFQAVPPQSCRRLLMDVVVAASGQQVQLDLNGTRVHHGAAGRMQLVVVADSETAGGHPT